MRYSSDIDFTKPVFREIEFGSDEFRQECELCNEVLRVPLGLNLFDEDISLESQQMHFGMFDHSGNLVACIVAVTISPAEAKLRQMAVDRKYQGIGHGRSIIHYLENHLAQRGYTHLFMHARMTAVRFYEKLGYERVGQTLIEIGIPHIRMEKIIRPGNKQATHK